MSEEKPFEASTARIARAKREGDLPRSQDLNGVASFGLASLAVTLTLPVLALSARRAFVDSASGLGRASPLPYVTIASCALAIVVSALAGALLATYLQARSFTLKFPAPKFEKLDVFAGLKRMLSRDSLVGGAKATVVSSALAVGLIPAVKGAFFASGATTPQELAALTERSLGTVVASVIGAAAFVAVVDLLWERQKWRVRLKMSFDELRRDQRQSEGDPQLKGRRRQTHRSLVRGSLSRVADAAFVVANPTHVAVALEYRPPSVAVPRVIVRAIDSGALRVKRRARELRVPVIENVQLARALLATTGLGECIAPDLYGAVAAIVALLAVKRDPA